MRNLLRWATLVLTAAFASGCGETTDPESQSSPVSILPGETIDQNKGGGFGLRNDDSSAAGPSGPQPSPAPDVTPRFINVAQAAGIDFLYQNDQQPGRFFLPEIMGGGVGWFDFDNDGWLDMYLMDGGLLADPEQQAQSPGNRLYRNQGGRFEEISALSNAAHRGYGHGCFVGDYDGDGFDDLYLTNFGANALLRNNGDGTLEPVTREAGVEDPVWSFGATWFDVDGDDDLDLFVADYITWSIKGNKVCDMEKIHIYCGPGEYEGVPDKLFVNQGDGTFVESAIPWGLQRDKGKGLAVTAVDLDQDLKAEVYVANDMTENFLFTQSRPPFADAAQNNAAQNDAKPFINVGAASGAAFSDVGYLEASMGIAVGDFDRDSHFDLFLTHFHLAKNTLYQNLGGLRFVDNSKRTRVAIHSMETLGFGTTAFDYDRDGWLDLIVANGHVFGPEHQPSAMRPQLLRNTTKGRFDDVSDHAGVYFQELWLGRGLGSADFDNDGDLDFAITHLDRPVSLLQNETITTRAFLGLMLRTTSRVPPVGGRVLLKTPQLEQWTPIIAGGTYLCSNDDRLLFGVDPTAGPVSVQIHWPSGRVDNFANLELNRYWLIHEGQMPIPLSDPP